MSHRNLFVLFLSIFGVGGIGHGAPPPGSVVTIEDLLKRESLSDLWFSPDGESAVFQIEMGPADRRKPEFFGSWMNGQHLYIANVHTGVRHELLSPEAELSLPFLRLDPWRGDGEALLMMATASGSYRLSYWNKVHDRVHVLPGRPHSASIPMVKWAGRNLVYASLSDDAQQNWSRPQHLEFLARQWSQSWSREGVGPTISSVNQLFKTTEPTPGFLYACDTQTAVTRTIARGEFEAISISPNGRWVSAVRKAEVIKDALGDNGQRGELLIFDLSAREPLLAHTAADLDVHPDEAVWAQEGPRVVFGAKRVGETREAVRLFEWNAQNGATAPVTDRALQFAMPFYGAAPRLMPFGWIGGLPAAIAGTTANTPSTPEAGRWTYGREAKVRFDMHVFGPNGEKNLTAGAKDNVRQFVSDREGNALAIVDGALWRVTATDARAIYKPAAGFRLTGFTPPGLSERYARDIRYHSEPGVERIAVQIAEIQQPAKYAILDVIHSQLVLVPASDVVGFSPDLLHVITRETDRWSESYVYDGNMGEPLASVNQNMNSRTIAKVRPFTYQAAGVRQKGWYVLPPHADLQQPLPAVVWIYGGHVETERPPTSAATTGQLDTLASGQLLAAQGYVVVYASYPLQPGQSSNLMSDLATQAVSAIDQLATDHIVDPGRVALAGHSFGGFSTAAVLTQRSDRFRAGIASAGIYDPIFMYGNVGLSELLVPDGRLSANSINAAETGQLGLVDPPWVNPEAYIRNSPIFHVDKIDTPLLILQGDLDGAATSLTGAARFYEALVRAGKKPTFIRFWGESHMPVSAATQRDRWNAVASWLRHYLSPP